MTWYIKNNTPIGFEESIDDDGTPKVTIAVGGDSGIKFHVDTDYMSDFWKDWEDITEWRDDYGTS